MGRLFTPDYLVVLNPRNQFSGDRFRYVEESRAEALFTQLDLGISHPNIVRFRLGKRGGTDVSDPESLPYTRNSPYVALSLALYLGAKRIGLIGVDFTEHHFFGTTGTHPLSGQLKLINDEYSAIARACARLGIEVYNLSATSRLTAFPKIAPADFARNSLARADTAAPPEGTKVFCVNYRFLSCGEVFSDGLRHAARDLGVQSEGADWDDAELPAKVKRFAPDLLFAVHGRKYSQRWRSNLHSRSAVWLLDEPYEVDDTSTFSQRFETVFVNDPATLHRHRNAHYLPVCYDPSVYHYRPGPRQYRVGFIGGANAVREGILARLARRGLLSYTVGGPWSDPEVRRLCLGGNIAAATTADFYRQTQIVVNVFRTAHHYNRDRIPAVSMNPRIYEALACGALVISERRPEIERLCPEMPMFDTPDQLISKVESLLSDTAQWNSIRKACIRRLARDTYAQRLYTVLATTLGKPEPRSEALTIAPHVIASESFSKMPEGASDLLPGWEYDPLCARRPGAGVIALCKRGPATPGGEAGMTGREPYAGVRLSFDVSIEPGAIFLAKIHLAERGDQKSNSYHLVMSGPLAYLARHNQILQKLVIRNTGWHSAAMSYQQGELTIEIDGQVHGTIEDGALSSGYCFLGVQKGTARVRKIAVNALESNRVLTVPAIASGRRPRPQATPFTKPPVRNLIYHIWPVRGSMWRWNLDQLKARIDLFNGRRLIGIVHDKRSEDPGAVEAYLEGHGCEFLVALNQPSGEHAKGVRHEPSVPNAVRRWADVSYRAALDDWRAVCADLERFALTGSFRMFGRFRPHGYIDDWHYSGTYYWMRHARVFARNCLAVPQFYCGVEAWPGKYFARHEAGCLLFDDLRQLAYDERFWQTREADLERWEWERKLVEPPADLTAARYLEGHLWPPLSQRPDEAAWLLDKLAGAPARTILVTGAMQGPFLWHAARIRFRQNIRVIGGEPHAAKTRAQLASRYDAVLIGGDRSYRGAKSAFDFAVSLGPSVIALQDIVDSHWHAQSHCCVSRLWTELGARYRSESRATGEWVASGSSTLRIGSLTPIESWAESAES